MTLINNFFKVLETSVDGDGFITTIKLNPAHIVYAGHFPGHPVTPGVIQLQIVHELLEKHLCKKFSLITMVQCKFQKILNPELTTQVIVHIEFTKADELLKVKARGVKGTDIFFKLEGVYK